MLPSTFVSLLFSSESVSRGSCGGGTVGEMAPSLFTAPWRKELLMLAGDVESNPGPWTDYIGEDLCRHVPTSSFFVDKQMQYYRGVYGTTLFKSTNLITRITVNPNFASLVPRSCPAFHDSCAGRAWECGRILPATINLCYHGNM